MYLIAFLTDETLALLKSFLYLIIIFCCRGSECEEKICRPPSKIAMQKFLALSHKPIKIHCFRTRKCL